MAKRKEAQHGTISGYTTHYTKWKTPPCQPCKDAQNAYQKSREQGIRDELGYNPKRLKNHNMTFELYEERLSTFDGLCWLCQKSPAEHIDHNHACCPSSNKSCGKCFRGLLCSNCNTGLGLFNDSPSKLRRAIEYLSAA